MSHKLAATGGVRIKAVSGRSVRGDLWFYTGMLVVPRAKGVDSKGVMRQCVQCLGLRHGCATGALRTCRRSISLLISCLSGSRMSLLSTALTRLATFDRSLTLQKLDTGSRTEVVDNMESLCEFLITRKVLSSSPTRLLIEPALNAHLPRMLSIRRVSTVRTSVSISRPLKRHGETVVRILFSYKLEISRLITLALSRVFITRHLIEIVNGKNGRQLIPVSGGTLRRISVCLTYQQRVPVGPNRRSCIFLGHHKRRLAHAVILVVVGHRTTRTNVAGAVSPRALHRSFTARLLHHNTSVHFVRTVLKRRSVDAARVCARVGPAVLQRRVLLRRPEGVRGP